MNMEKKYKLALFGSYLEIVKDEECEECKTGNLWDTLRANMSEEYAEGVLACIAMQRDMEKINYKKVENIYNFAKPFAVAIITAMEQEE